MAVTLDGLTVDLPKEWGATQLAKGFEQSVVGQLKSSTPMNMGEYVIPQYEGGFELGYTAEMGVKPVSGVSVTAKTMSPHKFAGIVVVSKEFAKRNPVQMLQYIEQDMRNAVARQVDYAIFYGKSAKTGQFVPGVDTAKNYIDATTLRTELTNGDLVPQVLAGYNSIVGGPKADRADPSGFAFDTLLRTRLALASQQSITLPGAPTPMPNLAGGISALGGLNIAFGRTVAGRVGTNADTKTKGFVGDWDNGLRWGFVDQIDIQRSTEATIVDSAGQQVHLFQQNAMALLIEFSMGWAVMDNNYFAAYDDKVAG